MPISTNGASKWDNGHRRSVNEGKDGVTPVARAGSGLSGLIQPLKKISPVLTIIKLELV